MNAFAASTVGARRGTIRIQCSGSKNRFRKRCGEIFRQRLSIHCLKFLAKSHYTSAHSTWNWVQYSEKLRTYSARSRWTKIARDYGNYEEHTHTHTLRAYAFSITFNAWLIKKLRHTKSLIKFQKLRLICIQIHDMRYMPRLFCHRFGSK